MGGSVLGKEVVVFEEGFRYCDAGTSSNPRALDTVTSGFQVGEILL